MRARQHVDGEGEVGQAVGDCGWHLAKKCWAHAMCVMDRSKLLERGFLDHHMWMCLYRALRERSLMP